tara:strand:+ start:82 stop:324 length:243 start_codon:yes stop_codon:yes gene_type:complete
MAKEKKPNAVDLNLDTLKNPKVLIAGAIAALGGLFYAGEGFTIEFSTCATEEAPALEIIELEAAPEVAEAEAEQEEPASE